MNVIVRRKNGASWQFSFCGRTKHETETTNMQMITRFGPNITAADKEGNGEFDF